MPSRLVILTIAAVILLSTPTTRTQGLTLKDVLKNAAGYVAAFQQQLSGMAAEETYVQEVDRPLLAVAVEGPTRRVLRSDLLLVKPARSDRYVEFRDVFEVDGHSVRDRRERLPTLVGAGAFDQMREIITESARYNIGHITRNVNTPLLTLQFLDAAFQSRFRFTRATRERETVEPNGPAPAAGAAPDGAVFRVATEMWTVEYEERRRPTIIRTPRNQNLPARGRFWINPSTGAVLMSELVIKGEGLAATITVSYQSEPLIGFLVPVAMNESYEGHGERVTGRATYGRFRQLTK